MATDVPQRELRNDTGALLRRVRDGERLRITVNGHPAAMLVPLTDAPPPDFVSSTDLAAALTGLLAPDDDFGLADLRSGDEAADPFA
jgi:prevent-host-death family protein